MAGIRRCQVSAAMVLLIAASCGGGSGAVTAPNRPKQIAADKAIAKQAVLRPGDLPAGYKASPHQTSSSNKIPQSVARKFATCAHIPEAEIVSLMNGTHEPDKPSADSPDFAKSDSVTRFDVTFENNVEIDRSSKDLSVPLDRFGAKRALPCWKALFQAAFDQTQPTGASYRDLSVTSLPISRLGDQSAAFEARVTISASGRSVNTYLDFFLVRRGRAGISLLATGIGVRVDLSLERSLLNTVVGRLSAAT
jgi:hypothetical protein